MTWERLPAAGGLIIPLQEGIPPKKQAKEKVFNGNKIARNGIFLWGRIFPLAGLEKGIPRTGGEPENAAAFVVTRYAITDLV